MRRATALGLVLCAAALGVAPAAQARHSRVYVALGDSVTVSTPPGGSFAPRLYSWLRRPAHGGANRFVVLPSFTSGSIVAPGDALDKAIRLIRTPSNVVAVTLTTGGNDALQGACWIAPCPYPGNLDTILRRLNAALKGDPGRERLELLAYYGLPGGHGATTEQAVDRALLGSDMRIGCAGAGDQVGLNDDIACIGWRRHWIVVDAWPAFKAGGADLMMPGDIHPSPAGHALLARLFERACRPPVPLPSGADADGFLAARPANGGPGCVGIG